MHISRHSFAYYCYQRTKDVEGIKNAMPHSNLDEIANYIADLTNDRVDRILRDVFQVN